MNGPTPPPIISVSYGQCEAFLGSSINGAFNSIYQQAVAEGLSVFVAAGDEGVAGCNIGEAEATHGIAVNGLASSPYDVAVGGTDFGDSYAGTNATYWSATNTAAGGSALSYIPEIPWNNSCASSLISLNSRYATPYGAGGFCNSPTGRAYYLNLVAGSGGPSGCATGAASTSGVVSGTCAGYPKPSWQSVVGNPADKVRDLPDVSLFAANGVWGHYLVVCETTDGDSCAGALSTWPGGGGTSFAAPIMAGIMALVDQKKGASQGNPTRGSMRWRKPHTARPATQVAIPATGRPSPRPASSMT